MKREHLHAATEVHPLRMAKVINGGTIYERIGQQHDGEQIEFRLSRPDARGPIQLSVKRYTWDHGGHQMEKLSELQRVQEGGTVEEQIQATALHQLEESYGYRVAIETNEVQDLVRVRILFLDAVNVETLRDGLCVDLEKHPRELFGRKALPDSVTTEFLPGGRLLLGVTVEK